MSTPNPTPAKLEHCPQCDLPMLHYPAKAGAPERYWCPLDEYEIVDRTKLPMTRVGTPKPAHIIAEHLHADTFTARNRVTKERAVVTRCLCGDTVPADDFAAHVVSKLTDAGYSIVPSDGIVRTYQAASTLGFRYMLPKHFGCDREEAERWFKLHQSALDGLPGVDTVRLEYRDEYVTGWLPLAAAADGDTNG